MQPVGGAVAPSFGATPQRWQCDGAGDALAPQIYVPPRMVFGVCFAAVGDVSYKGIFPRRLARRCKDIFIGGEAIMNNRAYWGINPVFLAVILLALAPAVIGLAAIRISGSPQNPSSKLPTVPKERIIHSFLNDGHDGFYPAGSLISDAAGNLYGATTEGGTCGEYCGGTIFELLPQSGGAWSEQILYSFPANPQDGFSPLSDLVFDAAGQSHMDHCRRWHRTMQF